MTRPTYEVTKRYRDKAIRRITVDLPKDLVDTWESDLAEKEIAKAAFIRAAIVQYLDHGYDPFSINRQK